MNTATAENKVMYTTSAHNFSRIPGSPIAYWVSDIMLNIFSGVKVGDVAKTCMGMTTGDNDRFLRLWHEVKKNRIEFHAHDEIEAQNSKAKWFPYHKGGEFRRWYGNNDYIVNWENNGTELRNFPKSTIRNTSYYFQEGITWSLITTSLISFRYRSCGFVFGDAGPAVFPNSLEFDVLLGLLNTKIIQQASVIINPTINSSSGVVTNFPALNGVEKEKQTEICYRVGENVKLSKEDWDSFEVSWDFKKHPLI